MTREKERERKIVKWKKHEKNKDRSVEMSKFWTILKIYINWNQKSKKSTKFRQKNGSKGE